MTAFALELVNVIKTYVDGSVRVSVLKGLVASITSVERGAVLTH
jgi:hypothetical protein